MGEVEVTYDESVKAYVVGESREIDLFKPIGDLTDTQKAAVQSYASQQRGPLAQAQSPNAFVSDYETTQAFALAGALAPPEDPRQVSNIYRRSSALRPCVEAVATNAVGFGYSFEPVIDLAHADAGKKIREAIIQDRVARGDDTDPTDQDVAEVRARIERESLREKFKLERFFNYVCPTRSFNRLRWESRVEVESGGNAYWEVCRRPDGSIATWDRLEAHTVRLRRMEQRYTNVEVNQRRSQLSYERVMVPFRFRTFVQLVLGGAKAVYFKQFGDPRVMSSVTGRFYATRELLAASEGSAAPATEIIHWREFDTIGPYGLPPWYGAQYAVLGVMASERVNYDYFDNKAIPPWAVLVSGGKLATGAVDRIKEHLKDLKGQASWHKIIVLEAEGTSGSTDKARCKIELVPLLKDQPQDALFQTYEANNGKKVQQQWRLPDLLVGRSEESNKAQADAALKMAEQQVFQPIREEEDDFYNRFILPEMGILWWQFKTQGVVARDPESQTEIVERLTKAGILIPNEGRDIASDILNKHYAPIDEPWANIPQPLMLAGILPGQKSDGTIENVTSDHQTLAQRVIALRDKLRSNAESGADRESAAQRAGEAVQRVKVKSGEWDKLWEK